MTREEVAKKIIDIVAEEFYLPVNQVTENDWFNDNLGADSLDIVQIITKIEAEFEEYDLKMPDDEVSKLNTVGNVIEYVAREIKAL